MKENAIGHLVKTNPIQTQSNPISVKPKMNANVFATKDYKNETTLRPQKNKPNQSQFQMPTNPSKEREEKRVSGTFSGSRLPERIYYIGNPGLA